MTDNRPAALTVTVQPAGAAEEVKATAPANPLIAVTLICEVPVTVATAVIEAGVDANEKSWIVTGTSTK